MDDLTITRLCASAMGYDQIEEHAGAIRCWGGGPALFYFNPLHDDAQAMALMKKFFLHIKFKRWHQGNLRPLWAVRFVVSKQPKVTNADLNRAICECVAKMQKERG